MGIAVKKYLCTISYGAGYHFIAASFDTPEQLAAYKPFVVDPRTRPKGQRRGAIPTVRKWKLLEESN